MLIYQMNRKQKYTMCKNKNKLYLLSLCFILIILTFLIFRNNDSSNKEMPDNYVSTFMQIDGNLYFSAGYCLYMMQRTEIVYDEVVCLPGWVTKEVIKYKDGLLVSVEDKINGKYGVLFVSTSEKRVIWEFYPPKEFSPINKIGVINDFLVISSYGELCIYSIPAFDKVYSISNEAIDTFAISNGKIFFSYFSEGYEEYGKLASIDVLSSLDARDTSHILTTSSLPIEIIRFLLLSDDTVIALTKETNGNQFIYSFRSQDINTYLWRVEYSEVFLATAYHPKLDMENVIIIGYNDNKQNGNFDIQYISLLRGEIVSRIPISKDGISKPPTTSLQPNYILVNNV